METGGHEEEQIQRRTDHRISEASRCGDADQGICRKGGFSDATFYKRRAEFGGMDVSDMKGLEGENSKLKALAAQAKRELIVQMIERFDRSERRACLLVRLSRDSYRDPPVQDHQSELLSAAIIDIAQVRRRFGFWRSHDLVRPESPCVNHKRVHGLYSIAKLAVRKRRKSRRPTNERIPL